MTAPERMSACYAHDGRLIGIAEAHVEQWTSYIRADLFDAKEAEIARLQSEAGKMLAEQDAEYNRKTNAMIERHAEQIARLRAQVEAGEKNYLDLHSKAWSVWQWFEKARPDLIGPRATALGETLMGPRPYGITEPPAYQQDKEDLE